ncbi:MAG TPA: hypothetical protein VN345_00605 [Blastocatellia bacterium]|nr:hypothetical protein [Blastocatellia bacterium]
MTSKVKGRVECRKFLHDATPHYGLRYGPAPGRLPAKRVEQQKQRWFRRGLRWRAGMEATISTLKHPFSMWRATYKGGLGFERYVGWCVITKNLFSIARYQVRRRGHGQVG